MKRSSTPLLAAHACIVLPANSGPLSVRMTLGRPRRALAWLADVQDYLSARANARGIDVAQLVNELLKKDIELIEAAVM